MSRIIRRLFSIIVLSVVILIIFKNIPFLSSEKIIPSESFIFSEDIIPSKDKIPSKNITSLGKTIVIDAGHGGGDPGTVGFNGSYEKDINLEISKKIIKKLENKGYNVISTRNNDEYISNTDRARLANKSEGEMFISIHCNSIENNTYVKGVQVLYYTNKQNVIEDLNNSEMAQLMIDSIVSGTDAMDKGIIERRDLIVLSQTNIPAMIIETGFLSNPEEEKLLGTDKYQNKLADSIIEGMEKYLIP